MSHISPAMQEKINTLEPELRQAILDRDVQVNTLQDLIHVLEDIVAAAE